MHYKNGREAKPGDRVIFFSPYGGNPAPQAGIIHSLSATSDACNARLSLNPNADPSVNIKDCLHADDVAAATIPDQTAIAAMAAGYATQADLRNAAGSGAPAA